MTRKLWLGAALGALLIAAAAPWSAAKAHGGVSIGVSTPDFGIRIGAPPRPVFYPAPVYAPPPVVYVPPPHYIPPRVVYGYPYHRVRGHYWYPRHHSGHHRHHHPHPHHHRGRGHH